LNIKEGVTVACDGNNCDLRCPAGLKPSFNRQLKCVVTKRRKTWQPKKIKKGVHCVADGSNKNPSNPVTPSESSSGGGFGGGANNAAAWADIAPEAETRCGNAFSYFKIDPTAMRIDCDSSSNGGSTCNVKCLDKKFKPTQEVVKCIPRKKRGKFAPKKANIRCTIPASQNGMRKLDSLAEETCGFLPVLVDKPAEYFCEDYTCHFYCSNEFMKPNVEKLTCNKRKKSWWPKRLNVYCQ
jgi:hypothetical protein